MCARIARPAWRYAMRGGFLGTRAATPRHPHQAEKNRTAGWRGAVEGMMPAWAYAPSWKRWKATTVMVSPSFLPVSATSFSTEMEGSFTNSWLSRQLCL